MGLNVGRIRTELTKRVITKWGGVRLIRISLAKISVIDDTNS